MMEIFYIKKFENMSEAGFLKLSFSAKVQHGISTGAFHY